MEYTLTVRQAERRRKNGLRAQKRRALGLPRYTLGEEVFSAVSHGVSALFAAGALVFLLVTCRREPLQMVCAGVFGGTMVLLYTVSTLYHGLGLNRAKVVFRSLDHCTISCSLPAPTPPSPWCAWGAGKAGPCLASCGPLRCWAWCSTG